MHSLDRWFRLSQSGATVRGEVLGGATTFFTMAYIAVVNPAILKFAGIPVGPSTVATLLTAVVGSLLMAFLANRPFAVAPYMGENAFIAFSLAALNVTWQQRLGAVFVAGVAFVIITLAGVRGWLAASISTSMKHAFGAGIGLFLGFIGLFETGIVVSGAPAVPVKIGNLADAPVLLAVLGFALIALLFSRRVPGAILIGMVATALVGALTGHAHAPRGVFALPFAGEYSLAPIAFQLDIAGVLRWAMLPALLTLVLMSFFDTLGTLVGLGSAAQLLDAKGNLPEIEKPMLVDALSCAFSGLVGTSTSGVFIESATGIRAGARTGLAAVVTAALFALSLFLLPLIEPLQALRFAYGPALIAVGALMLGSLRHVDFDDLTEAIPAFATVALIAFTYNIANGLTAGLLLHPVLKAAARKPVNGGSLVLGAVSLLYYAFGLPH
ncbi:MAG TPA: NCS2 family permease [Myxococcales bacterium]|nr:NCS2 family permease [Myxococcales bacterium]